MQRDLDQPGGLIIIERSLPDNPHQFRPADALVRRLHPPTGITIEQAVSSFVVLPQLPGRVTFLGDLTSTDDLPPPSDSTLADTRVTIPLANINLKEVHLTRDNITIAGELEDLMDQLDKGIPSPQIVELGDDLTRRAWRIKIIQRGFEDPIADSREK